MRTIKEEEVELSEYEDYWDAYRQLGQFFIEDVYNGQADTLLTRISDPCGGREPMAGPAG